VSYPSQPSAEPSHEAQPSFEAQPSYEPQQSHQPPSYEPQPAHEPQPFFAPPVGQPLAAPLAGQAFSAPPGNKPFSAPPAPMGRHAAAEPEDAPYFDFELGQATTQPIPHVPAPLSPTALWVAFGAGIAGFVGSFMPWVKINFFGGMSSSGVDGSDGWYSVILGAAIAAIAIWHVRNPGRHRALSLLALLCTIGLAGLGIYEVVHLAGDIPNGEFAGTVSVGIGLWLIIAAGVVGAVAMVRVLRGRSGVAGKP
jgi:hypothetical protein